jgi:hypothetical protein
MFYLLQLFLFLSALKLSYVSFFPRKKYLCLPLCQLNFTFQVSLFILQNLHADFSPYLPCLNLYSFAISFLVLLFSICSFSLHFYCRLQARDLSLGSMHTVFYCNVLHVSSDRAKNKMADNHVSMAVVFDVPEGKEFK